MEKEKLATANAISLNSVPSEDVWEIGVVSPKGMGVCCPYFPGWVILPDRVTGIDLCRNS